MPPIRSIEVEGKNSVLIHILIPPDFFSEVGGWIDLFTPLGVDTP